MDKTNVFQLRTSSLFLCMFIPIGNIALTKRYKEV